ncbi:unnamed protein product [[Candida] boidinii]|uniref:Unnamed protein product n=1 Tax=Candida boidinii TaxID=5477 RepID=A0A9W6T878_CANBO|nr:unnamed protein product [[Candida] boidinii]
MPISSSASSSITLPQLNNNASNGNTNNNNIPRTPISPINQSTGNSNSLIPNIKSETMTSATSSSSKVTTTLPKSVRRKRGKIANANGVSSTSSSNSTNTTVSTPRKKRECPICHNFYSNLTTHKSIHSRSDIKPYVCSTCQRGFKRLNDLLRHEKCHLSQLGEWEFQCPYHKTDCEENESPCHHTGYFSRCDTYKNHLKAIHFAYPVNTQKCDRYKVEGTCKECHLSFANVQEWLVSHVESGNCKNIINHTSLKK